MNKEKIIECVHCPLDYSKYESTIIRNNTNCYAHAIGSTYPELKMYRIGAISQLKSIEKAYVSEDELKALFLEDMQTLNLEAEEIKTFSKQDCLSKIENANLKENEHLILLFGVYYGSGKFADFHFWRYDEKGFSEKRKTQMPIFIENPNITWSNSMNLIGLFRIKK